MTKVIDYHFFYHKIDVTSKILNVIFVVWEIFWRTINLLQVWSTSPLNFNIACSGKFPYLKFGQIPLP